MTHRGQLSWFTFAVCCPLAFAPISPGQMGLRVSGVFAGMLDEVALHARSQLPKERGVEASEGIKQSLEAWRLMVL